MTGLIKYKPRAATNLIILHDSHTMPNLGIDSVPRWAELARTQGRKIGLLDIGYHFIVERGEVIECRPRDLIGSHCPGYNMDSIGICLVGGRDVEGGEGVDNFPKEDRIATLRLCHELKTQFGMGVRVKGHSEVQKFRNRSLPPCPPIDMDLFREDLDLFAKGYLL